VSEFTIAIGSSLTCIVVGIALFRAIAWSVAWRLGLASAMKQRAIFVLGACLLSLGVLWTSAVVVTFLVVLSWIRLDPAGDDLVGLLVLVDFMFSGIPLGGALLLSVHSLLARSWTAEHAPRLYRRLDVLSIVAWYSVLSGVVVGCLATVGFFPLFLLLSVLLVVRIRHTSQQSGLVWVLAIAAEKKLPLGVAVQEYAAECRGRFQRCVMQFADRLNSGQSLPAAIEADNPYWLRSVFRPYAGFAESINITIPLLPAPARVAARVGWETGRLGPSLREIATSRSGDRPDWFAALGRLLLLIIPLIILQDICGFVLFFIAPKFRRIFMDFQVEFPPVTKFVNQVSDRIVSSGALPIIFFIELIIGLFLLASLRSAWSFWPTFPVDRFLRGLDRAVILRALAICTDGGQSLMVGLRALADCYPKMWVRIRLERAIERTGLGAGWADSLRSQRLIRRADAALLESAERAGNLSWALREIATRAERRLAYALQTFAQLLYPIILLGIAAVIFVFAFGYFSPLVKLIGELTK
jgi:type II secretory pathway component PulF